MHLHVHPGIFASQLLYFNTDNSNVILQDSKKERREPASNIDTNIQSECPEDLDMLR